MSRRLTQGAIAGTTVAMGLALFGPSALAAASPDRVTVDAVPSSTTSATRLGATSGAQHLHMSAVLSLRDEAGATRLAAAVSDPASPSYRHFVSAASWRAQFAPTGTQVANVTRWLRGQGFTVGAVPANGRLVSFDGTAAQAEKAFGVTLGEFVRAGSRFTAPTGATTVPAALRGIVTGISGLDTSPRMAPAHVTPAQDAGVPAAVPAAVPEGTLPGPAPVFLNAPPCSQYYGQKPATGYPQILPTRLTDVVCGYKPDQVRGAYGLDASLAAGRDGRGSTVAIVDAFASPTIRKDAQHYADVNDATHPLRDYQLSQNLPSTYTHTGDDPSQGGCGPTGWYGEETLDVESVHATAPAANILYVGAASCYDNDLSAAVNSVIDNQLAQVVTNSYGEPELAAAPASTRANHQSALQAAAEGISLLFSSADSGDFTVDGYPREASAPANDSAVTAVGGTAVGIGKDNQRLFEQGWGTGSSLLVKGKWDPNPPAYAYGGGGGPSHIFTEPAYQKGVVPKSLATEYKGTSRVVPDVAMIGDTQTGFLVGQTQTFPDGTVKYSEYRIGGTSVSSPMFAGVLALGEQYAGGSLGFINPTLYGLNGKAALHDVDDQGVSRGVVRRNYTNGLDASGGFDTFLRTINQTGTLSVAKGYDDVTGVGTPNGIAFLSAIAR